MSLLGARQQEHGRNAVSCVTVNLYGALQVGITCMYPLADLAFVCHLRGLAPCISSTFLAADGVRGASILDLETVCH